MDKAVIYARYSSSSQNEQSIETQIDICKTFAKNKNLVVIKEYIDKGISGTSANRPGFKHMINDSYSGSFQYVIVYKLDRFARDEYDDIRFERLLNDNGVTRLSATEEIPDDYFSGALIKAVTRLNNENYSRLLSQRVTAGLNKNVEKGLMVGGSVTFGYDMVDKKYVINQTTSLYIKMIFDMYASGSTAKEIAAHLNSKGILNANNKPFAWQHIYKILKNKRYIGVFKYKGKEYNDFIPPIIDRALFDKAHSKLGNNATKKGRVRNYVKYLLTGKLYCGHCGQPMSGISGTSHTYKKYYYYQCKTPGCDKQNEKKDNLEDMVVYNTINEVVKSPNLDVWIKNSLKIHLNSFEDDEYILKDIKSKITKTKNEIDNILTAIKQGIITSSTKSELETLEQRLSNLTNEYDIKSAERPDPLTFDDIKEWFNHFNFEIPTQSDKEDIIEALVDRVDVYDDKLVVYYNLSNELKMEYMKSSFKLTTSPPNENLNELYVYYSPSHLIVAFTR